MDSKDTFFGWIDYAVFSFLLAASALIGVYFAFCAKQKQNTTSEYLLGSKKMGIFPISMSLIASYISGISILGFPSEMYTYGTQLSVIVISKFLTAGVMAVVIIPVFYKLQITSSYEYLNRRFNPTVRTLGSLLFLCKMSLSIPIVIYGPALAFSQVSGFSLKVLIPTVCIVCIFYTTLGGIKAVVWTDTLQTILMLFGVITVAVIGTYDVGGLKNVIEISDKGERLEFFNTSWDPTIRHTLWNVLIGFFFLHLAGCTINQAMVQRCLSLPTLKQATITIWIFAFGVCLFTFLCCYTGLVIYAAFHDCDPIKTGTIRKADQLLPYFVMTISSYVPGLPGIFVSGVFSAALSTMSTGLNSMCGVILEDFIKPIYKKPISEARASLIMKVTTVLLGTLFTLLAFMVDRLGGLIQAAGSLGGITGGTLLGMFMLGMLFPWANAAGAISGGVCAGLLVGWMSLGTQWAIHEKMVVFPTKPKSVEGCDNATLTEYWRKMSNVTTVAPEIMEPVFPLYTVSYVYYALIGLTTVLTVGMIVSFFTGMNDPSEMDPDLFSPVIQRFLNTKNKSFEQRELINIVTSDKKKPILKKHRR